MLIFLEKRTMKIGIDILEKNFHISQPGFIYNLYLSNYAMHLQIVKETTIAKA